MQSNVEEIISYMHENFSSYELFERQVRQITRELMELGYTLEEITRGINAYLVQMEPESTDEVRTGAGKKFGRQRTFRVLDPIERRFIGRDAYGYLCLVRELGLVSNEETEELIGYITNNRIEVDNGDHLQAVMMELMVDNGYDPEYDEDEEEEVLESGKTWHVFRRRLN